MKTITKKIRSAGDSLDYSIKNKRYVLYCSIPVSAATDIKVVAEYCNMLTDKINELNEEIIDLKKQLAASKVIEFSGYEEKEYPIPTLDKRSIEENRF